MILALSAIASMLLIVQFFAPRGDAQPLPTSAASGSLSSPKGVMFAEAGADGSEIQIPRDSSGQFHLRAKMLRRLNGPSSTVSPILKRQNNSISFTMSSCDTL